jgi:hypothetical protein
VILAGTVNVLAVPVLLAAPVSENKVDVPRFNGQAGGVTAAAHISVAGVTNNKAWNANAALFRIFFDDFFFAIGMK